MIGPPGTGKGTQTRILVKEFGFAHLSTGELLRAEIDSGSDLGKHIASIIDDGNLMPDEMVNDLMRPHILVNQKTGFVLDGYPRRIGQADAIEALLPIDIVLNFTVLNEDELVKKILTRRVCKNCGHIHSLASSFSGDKPLCPECENSLIKREDDSDAEKIRHRIKVYHSESEILIEYYIDRGLLYNIQSEGIVEDVHEKVMESLRSPLFIGK